MFAPTWLCLATHTELRIWRQDAYLKQCDMASFSAGHQARPEVEGHGRLGCGASLFGKIRQDPLRIYTEQHGIIPTIVPGVISTRQMKTINWSDVHRVVIHQLKKIITAWVKLVCNHVASCVTHLESCKLLYNIYGNYTIIVFLIKLLVEIRGTICSLTFNRKLIIIGIITG